MSDKHLVQQALASDIAEILLQIPKLSSALSFLRGFWEAMVREWSGIDRLRCVFFDSVEGGLSTKAYSRIAKYYMLVRRVVNATFRLLLRAEWADETCVEYNSILTPKGGPLW